jgi:hypothetical protein
MINAQYTPLAGNEQTRQGRAQTARGSSNYGYWGWFIHRKSDFEKKG